MVGYLFTGVIVALMLISAHGPIRATDPEMPELDKVEVDFGKIMWSINGLIIFLTVILWPAAVAYSLWTNRRKWGFK